MNPESPIIQILQVSKVYTDFWGRPRVPAIEDLSLEVSRGEVLGLLGPNGAGKSTTIKLLLGLLHPTRGRLAVFEREPRDPEVRRRTGYLPEETKLHKFLTASETLDFFGHLLGLERRERQRRTAALLEMVGLSSAKDRQVGEMSKGMARRIGLGVALVGDPELLVLDEPTSGLDPLGMREVKDLLIELSKRGKTILLSSHLLADVEDACHRIAILYGGKLRALGKTQDLLARDERIQIELDRPDAASVQRLEALAREVAGGRPVSVGAPRDRLEAFFLRVIGAARAEHLATAGAREGKGVASFLGADATKKEAPPAPMSVEATPKPAPMSVEVTPKATPIGVEMTPKVAPISVEVTPKPAPTSVEATPRLTPKRAPALEAVAPEANAAAETAQAPSENPKTRAVLERLMKPKDPRA